MNKLITFFRESGTARFFIPVGIILIVFGIFVFIVNINNKNYIQVDAIVSKAELVEEAHYDENDNYVEATYNIYVKYIVDNNEYEEELGELSGYKENDNITIYYNPDDPTQITQTKSIIIPIILIALGCASLIGGIISAKNAIKRIKKMNEQERKWNNG